jgi:hypothetical protein
VSLEWASAGLPLAGEIESGDLHVVEQFAGGALVAVIDGLGHGPEAALASRVVAATLRADPTRPVVELLQRCHQQARGTRGVVVSVAALDTVRGRLSWCGVGNVEACLVRPPAFTRETLVPRNGVVGYAMPPAHETTHALLTGDLLIFATDGISTRFVEELAPVGSVEAIAGELLARFGRGNDDALVLVARFVGAAS